MRCSQLRAFHYVALCGRFSRAAEVLNQTQPALSDQVKRLEQAHDTLLFRRERRQVHLTEVGEGLFRLTNSIGMAQPKPFNIPLVAEKLVGPLNLSLRFGPVLNPPFDAKPKAALRFPAPYCSGTTKCEYSLAVPGDLECCQSNDRLCACGCGYPGRSTW